MNDAKQIALLWSGGKDSALALHYLRRDHPNLRVAKLVTCISQAYDRVSMHGVRRRLIEDQAKALGLPVEFIVLPSHDVPKCPVELNKPCTSFPSNDTYTQTMLAALRALKADGIEAVAFGDIYLADLREFRDQILAHVGLDGIYPLWGRDSGRLFDEFVELDYQAITVCVDTLRLTAAHCGQVLTSAFRAALPDGADPSGERGEYHSFTFGGPAFRERVGFRVGDLHSHEPFLFQELLPLE